MKSLLISGLLIGLMSLVSCLQAEPQSDSTYAVSITVSGSGICYIMPQYTPEISGIYNPIILKLTNGINKLSFFNTAHSSRLTGFAIVLNRRELYLGHPLILPLRHHYTIECNAGAMPRVLD